MGVREKRRAAAARGPRAVRGRSEDRLARRTARRFGVLRDGEPRRVARRPRHWRPSIRARTKLNRRRTRRAIYGDLLGEAVRGRAPNRYRFKSRSDGVSDRIYAAQNLPFRTSARDVLGRNSRTMMSSSVNRVATRGGFSGSTRRLGGSAGGAG